jgi:tRNA(Arg) A34 adenosine deaminase TadA
LQWSELPEPWQACWQEGWNAWLAGSLFIGAVVTDAAGQIVARGRNHIFDVDAPPYQVRANQLAHAELNALLSLAAKPADVHSYHIYTLVEPCPLCLGAIYMSGVRSIHYAARDPYAGSTNLLGTTPYLARKPVQAHGPALPALESMVVAMGMFIDIQRWPDARESVVLTAHQAMLPEAVALAWQLAASGAPYCWRQAGLPAAAVFEQLMQLV